MNNNEKFRKNKNLARKATVKDEDLIKNIRYDNQVDIDEKVVIKARDNLETMTEVFTNSMLSTLVPVITAFQKACSHTEAAARDLLNVDAKYNVTLLNSIEELLFLLPVFEMVLNKMEIKDKYKDIYMTKLTELIAEKTVMDYEASTERQGAQINDSNQQIAVATTFNNSDTMVMNLL